jgi:hypothetical protein
VTEGLGHEARASRDLLIDLLGLGHTYPVRDLAVGFGDEILVPRQTVAFGVAAEVVVAHSQPDVDYQLRTDDGDAVPGGTVTTRLDPASGSQRTTLTTPPVLEDSTFRLLAVKRETSRSAYLEGTATVKVGLDVDLPVQALPGRDIQYAPDLRLAVVPFGAQLDVEVGDSQAGVEYALVTRGAVDADMVVSTATVAGRRGPVLLHTVPLTDDVEVSVRATRTLDTGDVVGHLATVLRVWVRADAAAAVTTTPPDGVVDHEVAAQVRVRAQDGVRYRLHAHPVGDRDWLRDAQGGVSLPPSDHPAVWSAPPGFDPLGEPVVATAGWALLETPPLHEDMVVVVQAERQHDLAPGGTSAVEMASQVLLLVRPDSDPQLRLRVGTTTDGTIERWVQVLGGQPGVRYHVESPSGTELSPWPAYIHRRDDDGHGADGRNHGLGLLAVEVDLAVATDQSDGPVGNPATTPPTPPVLDIPALTEDATLTLRAVRAQTGVATRLARAGRIHPMPAFELLTPMIAAGTAAKVRVSEAPRGQRLELRVGGATVGTPKQGTGKAVTLSTGPLEPGDRVELVATSLAEDQLPVERVSALTVTVTPSPAPPPDTRPET